MFIFCILFEQISFPVIENNISMLMYLLVRHKNSIDNDKSFLGNCIGSMLFAPCFFQNYTVHVRVIDKSWLLLLLLLSYHRRLRMILRSARATRGRRSG